MKTCVKCHAEKPETEYWRGKRYRDGLLPVCKACNKAAATAWRQANRERVRAAGRKSYAAHAATRLASAKAWNKANPEKKRAGENAWRKRHRERWREIQRASAEKEPQEVRRARERAWREANPGKKLAARHHYRARDKGAEGSHTAAEWRECLASYHGLCVYCGAKATTRDHLIPLIAGGTNAIENIVPACRSCNFSKHKRPLLAWLATRRRKAA